MNLHKRIKGLTGFTLAEVLITLGIIGVVAAFTIPTLINDTNERETVERFMKIHSLLNNAVNSYMSDNGCVGDFIQCGLFDGNADTAAAQKAWGGLKPYFSMTKDCDTTNALGCFKTGSLKWLDNTISAVSPDSNAAWAKAILSDGMSVGITDLAGHCNTNAGKNSSTPLSKSCGEFIVDINGPKNPNQYGRDIFFWWVTNRGAVIPIGSPRDANFANADGTAKCNKDGAGTDLNGMACGGKLLNEQAINY